MRNLNSRFTPKDLKVLIMRGNSLSPFNKHSIERRAIQEIEQPILRVKTPVQLETGTHTELATVYLQNGFGSRFNFCE